MWQKKNYDIYLQMCSVCKSSAAVTGLVVDNKKCETEEWNKINKTKEGKFISKKNDKIMISGMKRKSNKVNICVQSKPLYLYCLFPFHISPPILIIFLVWLYSFLNDCFSIVITKITYTWEISR